MDVGYVVVLLGRFGNILRLDGRDIITVMKETTMQTCNLFLPGKHECPYI